MKKLVLLCLMAYAVAVAAQSNSKPAAVPQSGNIAVSVQNVDAQHLYRFVGNKFMISVPGFADSQVSLVCQQAEAQKQGNFWVITPNDSLGKAVKMDVFATQNGRKMHCGSRMYKAIDLHPYALLFDGSHEYGKASDQIAAVPRKCFHKLTQLQAYLPNTDLFIPWQVKSFVVRFPDGQTVECVGNKLSPEALRKMQELASGDVLVFQSIVADGAGSELSVHPLAVILK